MKAAAGLPFLLEEGMEVAFVPPREDAIRHTTVESVEIIDERTAEVHFADIDAISEARDLVGCSCLVRRAALDEGVFDGTPERWEGWSVIDEEAGLVGTVQGIVDNPGQMLLEVDRAQGVLGEGVLLIPIVDEIVRDVDVEGRTVLVNLPVGLLEL